MVSKLRRVRGVPAQSPGHDAAHTFIPTLVWPTATREEIESRTNDLRNIIMSGLPEFSHGRIVPAQAVHILCDVVDACRVSRGGGWPDDKGPPLLRWQLGRNGHPKLFVTALDISVLFEGVLSMFIEDIPDEDKRYYTYIMHTTALDGLHITYPHQYVTNCVRAGWYKLDVEPRTLALHDQIEGPKPVVRDKP